MKEYIKIHENDTAAVALVPLKKGEKADIDGHVVTLTENIPQGHKFAAKRTPCMPILTFRKRTESVPPNSKANLRK